MTALAEGYVSHSPRRGERPRGRHRRTWGTQLGRLPGVEAGGGEDGLETGADLVEFAGADVADAGDFAAAEVVDGEVEAVAGAAAEGGVDFVALGDADVFDLVVAVGEGDVVDQDRVGLAAGCGSDLCRGRCRWPAVASGWRRGLPGTGGGGGVGSDAEVDRKSR